MTLKVPLPLARAALAGKTALRSLEVIATVSLVLTKFQFASTARAVTLKAVPAVWAEGVPVLPVEVPGAAVSPGASNCNFAKAPTFTVIEELVLAVIPAVVASEAVTVALPVVFKFTLRV